MRQNEAGSVTISHLLLSIVSLRTLWVSLVIQLSPLIMLDDSEARPQLSQAVSAKLEDGNVRAAIRLLMHGLLYINRGVHA